MTKYYFVTYRGVRRDLDPSIDYWHDVISVSPMAFRKKLIDAELKEGSSSYYRDFIILNTQEISEEEYEDWAEQF